MIADMCRDVWWNGVGKGGLSQERMGYDSRLWCDYERARSRGARKPQHSIGAISNNVYLVACIQYPSVGIAKR